MRTGGVTAGTPPGPTEGSWVPEGSDRVPIGLSQTRLAGAERESACARPGRCNYMTHTQAAVAVRPRTAWGRTPLWVATLAAWQQIIARQLATQGRGRSACVD